MNRCLRHLLVVAFGVPLLMWPCDCGSPKPACAYLAADAIFVGRVSFTNDDGSGRFAQATLVRFDVEEQFKGIAADVRNVWVNPGSSTSCYANYELGERYLIFARKAQSTNDSAAMTLMRGGGSRKPSPDGFDPAKPPTLYYAPECAGSRPTEGFPNLDKDLSILRAYRAGVVLPRALGHVYLYPFRGWPVLSGPVLKGVRLTMSSGKSTLVATTDGNGNFALQDAPAGYYNAWADLPPYRMDGQRILHVPETGCGYADIQLATTTTLQGVVLDRRGRPAPKIPVGVWLKDKGLEDGINDYAAMQTTTDEKGKFTLTGLPDADVFLSAGTAHPTTDMPYQRVYYPEGHSLDTAVVVQVKLGEHRQSIVLRLDEPLERARATVLVVRAQGNPGVNASVRALDNDGVILESAKTDAHGVARISCLRGLKYQLEAQTLHQRMPWREDILKSSRAAFICGDATTVLKLVLDRSAPY